MKKTILLLLSTIVIFNVSAASYTLTSDTDISGGDHQISYSYKWGKVKDLSEDQREILNLTNKERNLKLLKARFIFFIEGDVHKFNDSFFSRKDVLEGLAGTRIHKERENLYSIRRSKLGIEVSANMKTLFNLDYIQYQSAFDYVGPEAESFVTHQVTENFNRSLERADVITQVSQQGDFVKFTIDSFAVMTKKEGSSFLSFAIRKILVSKMKSQILQAPKVFSKKIGD